MKKKVISLTLGLIFVLQMVLSAGAVFASDAPTVVSVTPSGDNVEKAAIGKVTFSTSMDRTTLTSENIIIEDEWGDVIDPIATTAWDKEFTFVAELESDTEYTVTVTSGVKSSAGVAATAYEHSFVTGNVSGIENVTPTTSANFSSNTSGNGGANGSLSYIYNGNLADNFTTYGGSAPKWIKVDLGKAYDIAYISYIPKAGSSYNDSWMSNHNVQVSKTGDDWVTLATLPTYSTDNSGAVEHVVAPVDNEKYQYVRIYRNSVNIACTEIDIYAYQGKPEVEKVSLSGEGLTEAAAGKVVFSTAMDRTTLTSENIVIKDEFDNVVIPTATSAYDREFVFTADFSANTEYIVSVSSKVKAANGMAVSASEHTFTTGDYVRNVENVTPALSSFSHNKGSGTSGSFSAVCDNNLGTMWNTFGGSGDAILTADLGKATDIAYIVYCGNRATDSENYASTMKIQVSKDNSAWTDLAMTPTLSAEKPGALKWIAINESGEDFQYVRITRASTVIYVAELTVYAYAGNPVVESVTPSGDDLTKVSAGKVTFSAEMERSTLTKENIVITDVTNNKVVEQSATSAYNREYVFTADFEPNTEYKVTVSNVKAANGMNVEAYEHTFTTGDFVRGVENVTPTTKESFTSSATAGLASGSNSDSTLIDIFDGKTSTKYFMFSGNNPQYFDIDLGKAYDISHISYVPGYVDASLDWPCDVIIQVSKDKQTFKDLVITPSVVTEDELKNVVYTIACDDAEEYQYVRITKNAKRITCAEIDVFAFEGDPVVESITPAGEDLEKVSAVKVNFSAEMNRSTLNKENIVITDEFGSVVEQTTTSAYNKEYVFTADFEPNTEYKVSVSNVKAANGLTVAAYEHTFTTGDFISKIENVTPALSGFSFKAGAHTNNLSTVCDNNLGTLWNTYGSVNPASLTADLGKAQDIAYIVYCGNRATDSENFAQNMQIQVSNDNATWITLATTPTLSAEKPGALQWIAVNETGESFQYVRLTRASNVIYVGEVDIYAYESAPVVSGTSFDEENVEYAKMMRIDFDKVMNRYTLTADNIIVEDASGNVVPQTVSQGYDKAYVFSCDFAPKSTYKVKVTTNVETLLGTPFAEEYEYTFTTNWLAPVKNVTPWSNAAYTASGEMKGTYAGNAEKSVESAIYTGGPYDMVYVSGSNTWIQTDLGKEYPIAYISYLPRNDGMTDEQYKGYMRGSEIWVSNDAEFKTYKKLDIVPEYYADETGKRGTYWNFVTEENGESYRYVRVCDSSWVFISELKVFAYQTKIEELTADDIDQVAKTDEYEIKASAMYGTVDSGETVTYMIEVDKLSDAASAPKVYAAIYGYNTNANRVLVNVVEATKVGDIYTVTVNIPSGLTEAEVNFFVWGEQTPLTAKVIKRNF